MPEIDELIIKVRLDLSSERKQTDELVKRQEKAQKDIQRTHEQTQSRIQARYKKTLNERVRLAKAAANKQMDQAERIQKRWDKVFDGIRSDSSAAFIAAGAAAVKFGKDAVQLASEMEQVESRFQAVFRDEAPNATAQLERMAAAIGRNTTELKSSAADLQGFFVGLGKSREEASGLSVDMTKLALDFASFNNISDDEAIGRFISALSGSSEVLDRYGINTKAAAIEQELLQMGIKKTTAQATENEKVMARIAIIQRSLGEQGATGDAARTADQFANVMKRLTAEVETLGEEIGTTLIPEVADLAGKWADFIKNLRTTGSEGDLAIFDAQQLEQEFDRLDKNFEKLTNNAKEARGLFQEVISGKTLADQQKIAELWDVSANNLASITELVTKYGLTAEQAQKLISQSIVQTESDVQQYVNGLVEAAKKQEELAQRTQKQAEIEKVLADQRADGFVSEAQKEEERKKILAERFELLKQEAKFLQLKKGLDENELQRLYQILEAMRSIRMEQDGIANKRQEPADPFAGFGGREGAQSSLDDIRNRNKEELAIMQEKYLAENELLDVALNNQLITQQQYNDLERTLFDEFEEYKTAKAESEENKRMRQQEQLRRMQLNGAKQFFGNIAQIANDGSKKGFEISKKANMAQIAMNIPTTASEAYKALAGIPVVGPALGIAAAAAATTAQLQNLRSISSQSFGGGGGGASSASAPAPAVPQAQPIAEGAPGGNGSASNGATSVIVMQEAAPAGTGQMFEDDPQKALSLVDEALMQEGKEPLSGRQASG